MELIRRGKHARGGGADGYGRRPGAGARRSSVNCATERDADGRSVRVKRQMHMMMDRREGCACACRCFRSFSSHTGRGAGHDVALARESSLSFLASPVTRRGHSQRSAAPSHSQRCRQQCKDDALYSARSLTP